MKAYSGFAEITAFNVTVDTASTPASYTVDTPALKYQMYHSLQLFFANGGSDCYIVSVGSNGGTTTAGAKTAAAIKAGIDKLKAEDGPTLVVPVDAVGLVADNADARHCIPVIINRSATMPWRIVPHYKIGLR